MVLTICTLLWDRSPDFPCKTHFIPVKQEMPTASPRPCPLPSYFLSPSSDPLRPSYEWITVGVLLRLACGNWQNATHEGSSGCSHFVPGSEVSPLSGPSVFPCCRRQGGRGARLAFLQDPRSLRCGSPIGLVMNSTVSFLPWTPRP